MFDNKAGQNLERRNQPFGISAAMRFDNADYDILALRQQVGAFTQHFKCFADAGRCAKKNLQPPACFLARLF